MCSFEINSEFAPKGDQKAAIENISSNLNHGAKRQTLLGVTGSGKTFTMASVISEIKRPALVIAHNKTLAARAFLASLVAACSLRILSKTRAG